MTDEYDLIVSGGTPAGLSLAIEAREAGLDRVLIIERGEDVSVPTLIGHHTLEAKYQERIVSVDQQGDRVSVTSSSGWYTARAFVVADHPHVQLAAPDYDLPQHLTDRIHIGSVPTDPRDLDLLVVGRGEVAVDWTLHMANAGAGVVLALGGVDLDLLSRVSRGMLFRLEAERKATVLWQAWPTAITELDGYPMAFFDDRQTPDLLFDHVVYALETAEPLDPIRGSGIEVSGAVQEGAVWWVAGDEEEVTLPTAFRRTSPGDAWEDIRLERFSDIPRTFEHPRIWSPGDREQIEALREEHYNGTITHFDRAHSDLWVIRVRPDHGDTSHLPGQYASLGLGYWEPRGDGALEPNLEDRWDRLIRRSYSISSRILDEHEYIVDPSSDEELEFYIVLVPPSQERIPSLTPRLALKRPGDRIYVGPKVAGRYTLAPVTDPSCQVLFLATGTGEAPHNAMIVELLRKGHYGPIASVVTVRHRSDLGYLDLHRALEERSSNYHYLSLMTREPGVAEKRYVQDVIRDDLLAEKFAIELDPARTHVYLCGNPAMIGLPTWENNVATFPQPQGVVELLTERGFTLDRRTERGNVHYEEYW